MVEVDYIIVGQGLAGSTLAHELLQRDRKVIVVDRCDASSSSRVAAGLITPVTGKGMNPGWRQSEYLEYAVAYYQKLERETGSHFYFPQPALRMFSSEKECKKWHDKKGENNQWAQVTEEVPDGIIADHGCLLMPEASWVDTRTYLDVIRDLLIKSDAFCESDFVELDVVFKNDKIYWRGFSARKIILCQGAYGLGDGWFSHVPHRSAKGEILTLKIDQLDPSFRYHANGWLAPRADGMWKAGSSYDWVNRNSEPTNEGREEVLSKTRSWVSKDQKIDVVDHAAGVRPIIRNSRPVIGFHHEMPHVGFFNGLGSKGTMMAPAVSKHFAKHLCGECDLDQELSLNF